MPLLRRVVCCCPRAPSAAMRRLSGIRARIIRVRATLDTDAYKMFTLLFAAPRCHKIFSSPAMITDMLITPLLICSLIRLPSRALRGRVFATPPPCAPRCACARMRRALRAARRYMLRLYSAHALCYVSLRAMLFYTAPSYHARMPARYARVITHAAIDHTCYAQRRHMLIFDVAFALVYSCALITPCHYAYAHAPRFTLFCCQLTHIIYYLPARALMILRFR